MNESLANFLSRSILENSIKNILFFVAIIGLGYILKKVFSKLLSKALYAIIKRKQERVSVELFTELLSKPIEVFLLLVIYFTAFSLLKYPQSWNLVDEQFFGIKMISMRLFQTAIGFSISWLALRFVDYFVQSYLLKQEDESSTLHRQLMPFVKELIKFFIVIFAVFIGLGVVFKLDIGAIIAGLGIGGLAVALAGKETIENLFGSFTIFLDSPFVVGDIVKVEDDLGTVEKIGFRSTRMRTFDQTLLTIPNKTLINNTLENLTSRTHRRAKYNISLVYNTHPEKMKLFLDEVNIFFEKHPKLSEDSQARFAGFGASSLEIEIMFFVNELEYKIYSQIKEDVNFEIIKLVKEAGCEFAFPTTTVILPK